MRGQGDFPWGAADDPNAPWNQREKMVECSRCGGVGMIYYAYDIDTGESDEVDQFTYESLPDDEDEARMLGRSECKDGCRSCDECDGRGEVWE